jgi:pyroglutamyl-peptidase
MNLLVTGFEPFGGSRLNPSELVAKGLAELQPVAGCQIAFAILPVDGQQAASRLLEAIRQSKPDAVICLGEASQRAVLSIERVAVNLLDYRIPDNSGNQFHDQPIVKDGPAAYFATLPVRAMLQAVISAGVPVELSLSAGSYLCNQVMYELLHELAAQPARILGGFIHLPALPEQVVERETRQPSMALATSLRGVTAALKAICQTSIP